MAGRTEDGHGALNLFNYHDTVTDGLLDRFEAAKTDAAVIVQAEVHETEDGEVLQVLGLVLPHGRTVVGFMDDVDEVDATDPIWLSLLEADPGERLADDHDRAVGLTVASG